LLLDGRKEGKGREGREGREEREEREERAGGYDVDEGGGGM
jgi:hypothetical protein